MEAGKRLLGLLGQLGRPHPLTLWRHRSVRFSDWTFLALPLLAFWLRRRGLEQGRLDVFAVVVGLCIPVSMLLASLTLPWRRGDPLATARDLDRAGDPPERWISAVECAVQARGDPMARLLVARAARDAATLDARDRVGGHFPWPHFKRIAVACLLTLLILLLPSFGFGGAGGNHASASGAIRDGGEAASEDDGSARTEDRDVKRDLDGKIEVTVTTNRSVYLLGEAIELTVQVKAREPLPGEVAVAIAVLANGEWPLRFDLPWVLPTVPDETRTATFAIEEPLRAIGQYRRGLLTLDTDVVVKDEAGPLSGAAPGNRVIVEIAENTERQRTIHPQEAAKQPKPRPQPESEKKPKDDTENQRRESEKKAPRPAPTDGPPPLGEIKANPFVVEPLFAGDQTSEREVLVYDRDKVDAEGERPPDPPVSETSRAYMRGQETEIIKVPLPVIERTIVRRYLDALRGGGTRR